MSNLDFGKQLRILRQQCHDLKTGKPISQQMLGQLLGQEMEDYGFSGAAISDWERNKSKIHADDRLLLTSLIKIFKRHGGIKTLAEANLLLENGNYRALNEIERSEIFYDEIHEAGQQSSASHPDRQAPSIRFLLENILFISPQEFQQILDKANEGPPPSWPRIAVALINRKIGQWTIFHVLKLLIWLWIWLIAYYLIAPSLQWPFIPQENASQIMTSYAAGTIILPLFIGAMIGIKNNTFWKEQKIPSIMMILYIYQGASIGFHLGYFLIFTVSMAQYYFYLQPAVWIEFIKMAIPIAVGYSGAQLVPYNLWLAYGRLHLKEGGIFFVFTILGPIWAWFFLEFYETLISQKMGGIIIFIAITMLTIAMAIQYRLKKNTIIPILWIVIFYGLILICQIAYLLIQ